MASGCEPSPPAPAPNQSYRMTGEDDNWNSGDVEMSHAGKEEDEDEGEDMSEPLFTKYVIEHTETEYADAETAAEAARAGWPGAGGRPPLVRVRRRLVLYPSAAESSSSSCSSCASAASEPSNALGAVPSQTESVGGLRLVPPLRGGHDPPGDVVCFGGATPAPGPAAAAARRTSLLQGRGFGLGPPPQGQQGAAQVTTPLVAWSRSPPPLPRAPRAPPSLPQLPPLPPLQLPTKTQTPPAGDARRPRGREVGNCPRLCASPVGGGSDAAASEAASAAAVRFLPNPVGGAGANACCWRPTLHSPAPPCCRSAPPHVRSRLRHLPPPPDTEERAPDDQTDRLPPCCRGKSPGVAPVVDTTPAHAYLHAHSRAYMSAPAPAHSHAHALTLPLRGRAMLWGGGAPAAAAAGPSTAGAPAASASPSPSPDRKGKRGTMQGQGQRGSSAEWLDDDDIDAGLRLVMLRPSQQAPPPPQRRRPPPPPPPRRRVPLLPASQLLRAGTDYDAGLAQRPISAPSPQQRSGSVPYQQDYWMHCRDGGRFVNRAAPQGHAHRPATASRPRPATAPGRRAPPTVTAPPPPPPQLSRRHDARPMPPPPQAPGFSRPVRVDERPMPAVWLRPRRDLFLGSLTSLLATEHELPPTQPTRPPAPPPPPPPPPAPPPPPPPAARATRLTAAAAGSQRPPVDLGSISLAMSTTPASSQRTRFVGPPPQYEANFTQDRPTQPTAQPTTQGRNLRVRTQHHRPPNPTMPAVRFPTYVSRRLPVGQRLPPGAEQTFISPRVYAALHQGSPHKTQSEWNYQPAVPPAFFSLRQPIPERLVLPTDILQGPPYPAYLNTVVSPRVPSDHAAFDPYSRECPLIPPTRQLSRVPEWSESAESEEEMSADGRSQAAAAEAEAEAAEAAEAEAAEVARELRRRRAEAAAEAAVAAAERELRRPKPRPRLHPPVQPGASTSKQDPVDWKESREPTKERPQDEWKASVEDVEAEEAEETDVEEKHKSEKEMETAANKMEETASKLEATQKHSMSSQTLEQATMAPLRARDAACMDLSQPFVELVRSLPWDSVSGVRRIEEVFVTDASGGLRDIPPLPLSAATGWPGTASAPAPATAAYSKPLPPPPPPPPAQPSSPVCTSARCACPVEKCRRAAEVRIEQGVQAPAPPSVHSARLPATRPCAGYDDKVYQEVTLTMVPPPETASTPSEALVTCEDLEEKKSGKPPCESCSKHPEQPQIPPDSEEGSTEPPQASPTPSVTRTPDPDVPPEEPSPPPEETPEAAAEKKRRSKCRRSACRKNAKGKDTQKGVAITPEDTAPKHHAVEAQPSENIDLVTKASEGTVMEKGPLEEECKAQKCRAECRDPRCRTTGVKAPEVVEPEVETPKVKEPEVETPEVSAPEGEVPEVTDYEKRKAPEVEATEDVEPEGKDLQEVPPPTPPPEEKVPEEPPPAKKKRRSKCFRRRSACSKSPPKEKMKDTKSVPETRSYERKPPDDKAQDELAPERKVPETVAPVPTEDRMASEENPPEDKSYDDKTPAPESKTLEEDAPVRKRKGSKCRRSACSKTPKEKDKRKRSIPETRAEERKVPEDIPAEDTRNIQDEDIPAEGIVPEEKVLGIKATECKIPECRSPGDKVPDKAVECKSAVCKSTGVVRPLSDDTTSEDETTAATTTPPIPKHDYCHAKQSSSKTLPCLADTIAPPPSTQQPFSPNLHLRYSCCPPQYQRHEDYVTPDLVSSAGYPQPYRPSYRYSDSYPGPRYSYPPPYVTPTWQHPGYDSGYSGSYSYPPPAGDIRPRSASEPRSPQAAPAPPSPPPSPPPPANVMMFDVVVRVIPRRHSV